jgi:LPS sulfotransferase NodH
MKILLLGTPRSGSTSLIKFINSHISLSHYKMMIEPFNNELNGAINSITPLLKYNNLLVKNLFLIGNDEYPKESFENVYEYFDWCYSFFDKIVMLDRKDKIAQSESFVINETIFREKGINWHTQKIYDLDKIDKTYFNEMIDRYTESSKILKEISNINNFPIFYYEDIFLEHNMETINNLLKYLGTELNTKYYNEFILSSYRRIRIEKSNKKLL